MMMMTNETTPDAVERAKLLRSALCAAASDADEIRATLLAERARHAEEVASMRDEIEDWEAAAQELSNRLVAQTADSDSLRDQLRKVEGERDTLAVRMDLPASQLLMVGSELCGDGKIDPNDHRDPRWTPTLQRAAEVMRELTARRALDADVMACAERCRDTLIGPPGMPVEDYPLAPEALAARRILAADFLREGGE